MNPTEVLGVAKTLSGLKELSCPNHERVEIVEAELYYSGFHNYRFLVCRECIEDHFQENSEIFMCMLLDAFEKKSDKWVKVSNLTLADEGEKWTALNSGNPVIDVTELDIGALGYLCPSCGIVKGLPVLSEQAASKEAVQAYREKEFWVECYDYICTGKGEILVEDLPEWKKNDLEKMEIYTCKACGKWIGENTGKYYYW